MGEVEAQRNLESYWMGVSETRSAKPTRGHTGPRTGEWLIPTSTDSRSEQLARNLPERNNILG